VPVGDELQLTVQYRKDLYSESTIDRILNHYRNVLSSATSNPDQPVHKLSMMNRDEIRQIVEVWNSEKAAYPTDATIHQLINAAAGEKQEAIALTYKGKDVSYRQLINRSNYIAGILIEMGVRPEVMVGVCMERSDNLIIALLAILTAGGVYVPLDPIYPDEKLAYMLQNSTAPILLTEESITASKFPDYNGKIIKIESLLSEYSEETKYDLQRVTISSGNSAYLIYTSGSTGKPKGVLVTHRNVVNEFCFADLHIDDANTSRTWLFSTSISFDPSVLEMFWTLSRGYRVIILPDNDSGKFLDINSIPELIQKYHVSHFQCTPSILRMLMDRDDGYSALKQLRKLMVGGECFPVALAKRLSNETSMDIYNVYGPTETTLWATWHLFQKDDNYAPIGCPLPNYKVYILDEDLQPVTIGVYGEMYIGGDGVAREYFNDPELTARKYLPDPFSGCQGDRMYRTGDIARYRSNGIIEFRGRTDRQVKIRGHRIELGEIEAAIMECGKVHETVVIASGNTDIDRKILGYVIPDFNSTDAEELDSYIKNLKETLNRKLPGFMIPSALTVLKEFPKLSNGKIDRKSLPLPEMPVNDTVGSQKELSPTECAIMNIWEDVLGFGGFDADDNYMEIGGNSLSAIIIVNRIKSVLKVKITIRDFLDNQTIKLLATLVEQRIENAASEPSDDILSIDRYDDIPLSFCQEARLINELSLDISNVPYLPASTWFSLRLFGNLDREALENAFNYVINRHEVFRTALWPEVGGVSPGTNKWDTVCQFCRMNPGLFLPKVKFKQSFQPAVTMNLDYYDVTKYIAEDKNIELKIIADEIIEGRYRYESPPLSRAALIRTAESEHILIVAASHLIADAFSIRIFEKEFAYAYSAFVNGQSVNLPDIKLQYADYAAWQKHRLESGSFDSIKSYWKKQFDGYIPTDVTILPFTDLESSEDADFGIEAKYYNHPITDELSGAIRKYAGSVNMTTFSIVMTGFILCLHCESGKNDIGIITFFANRTRPETENIIGAFVNGNIIRVKINSADSFYRCAVEVSEKLNGAFANQELMVFPPDSRVCKSLYDIVAYRPITCESWIDHDCASFSGLDVEKVILERTKSEYALRLFVVDSGKKLSLLFQYNLDIFDGADIRKMAAQTENIIKEIVTNSSKIVSSMGGL